MNYEAIRQFADSYVLGFMTILFVVFVGWTFRRKASDHHRQAAAMIFNEEDNHG